MTFVFSQKSLQRLDGVNPELVEIVKRALQVSTQDFAVIEGLRTVERQRYLFNKGATRTMASRHLTGDAVDLAPFVDGQVSWDWKFYYPIAEAMRVASIEHALNIRWGGSWCLLTDLPEKITSEHLSKSFPDGPHFEIPR